MPEIHPLSGFTVAVAADQRRDELAGLLRQRGARVVVTTALRVVPVADETELRLATHACTARPLDAVVATDVGLRGWLDTAGHWGLADALRARIAAARLIVRGPAARVTGLLSEPGFGCDDEVLDHLLDTGVAGKRIALQLPVEPQPEFSRALREAGASVVDVPLYQVVPPADAAPLRRLVDLTLRRLVDAVAFASASAVGSLLRAAGTDAEAVLDALRTDVVAACPGRCAAAPLRRRQVPVAQPPRAGVAGLVLVLADELPRRTRTLCLAGTPVTLRGNAAIVDGVLRPLAPAPMAVLRALADEPGRVLSRAALLRVLPRKADEHAVEMAVVRLRAGLGAAGYVQTVVKRGYRLPVDPPSTVTTRSAVRARNSRSCDT
jgi:uroporphyrinogen-III synthase